VIIKATGRSTLDAYALFEVHTPAGRGMLPHLQRYDDEALFVLEGTYAIQIGHEIIELGRGGCTFARRGTIHAYTNTASVPARLLIITSPGGIHERFFAALDEQVDLCAVSSRIDESRDFSRIAMLAEKYGIEFAPGPDDPD